MVHKHRSATKAAFAKDVSPMRNTSANKYVLSSSPNDTIGFVMGHSSGNRGSGSNARLAVPAMRPAHTADKWQYNNMVNNQRDQFNNLHFC